MNVLLKKQNRFFENSLLFKKKKGSSAIQLTNMAYSTELHCWVFFNQFCLLSLYLPKNSVFVMIFHSTSLIWEVIWLKELLFLPQYFCNSYDLCLLRQKGDSVLAHRGSLLTNQLSSHVRHHSSKVLELQEAT